MNFIKLKARAKINTALDVIGKFDNGYHNLRMIMQSVNLYDNLFIKKIKEDKIVLKTNLTFLPCDERNLVYKAAMLLKEKYEIKEGIYIDLHKRIPIAAGLAGGSSDCAATLIGIRRLFNLPISQEELMDIGKQLGADVPYCIMRGTALAEGIGEKLTKLPPFPYCYVLLSKPAFSVSTASVFKSLNIDEIKEHPKVDKMIEDIKNNDLESICGSLSNVLETVTIKDYPVIEEIKQVMLKHNALGSLMSGSGPTVFGIFTSKADGLEALKELKREYKIKDTFLTTVFNTK